ncbi:MAG: tripartite tricarboxylate transporter substrate binding protein [Acetobacteraceae bacterium]|nr:tripartite tricarboxylate transporter substrate binding protein [Acetobacteraceae bacterium]
MHQPYRVSRRSALFGVAGALGATGGRAVAQPAASAGDWPNRSVRVLVGYPAGGANDLVARAVAQGMSEALGQSVVVENRSGAAGSIAAEAAARATPDGYTLFAMASAHALAPAIRRNLTYDPVRDFAPIALAASAPYFLVVHPSMPVTDAKALIALARRQPGTVTFASSGVGAGPHLTMELLQAVADVQFNHVPYRGDADMLVDLIAGRVQAAFSSAGPTLPHLREGRLRALGVSGERRLTAAPDVPTVAEAADLPGFAMGAWWGIVAPAGTPEAVLKRAEAAAVPTIRSAAFRERFEQMGFEPGTLSGAEFGRFITSERDRLAEIVRRAGIEPQ